MAKRILHLEPEEWRFWLTWLAVNTACSIVGMLLFPFFLLMDFLFVKSWQVVTSCVVAASAVGALVGTVQWLVLRRRAGRYWSAWWVLASSVGLAVYGFLIPFWIRGVYLLPAPKQWIVDLMLLAAGGAAFGAAQWIAFPRRVRRSGWWVVANVVVPVGITAAPIVGGVMYGAITGIVLVLLLRRAAEQDNRSKGLSRRQKGLVLLILVGVLAGLRPCWLTIREPVNEQRKARWIRAVRSNDPTRRALAVKKLGQNSWLTDVSLRGADLREADLSEADLGGADLREADLREADLGGTDLREADLREADLSEADLRRASLSRADLRGTDLCKAYLSGAHLIYANLRGADLSEADLSKADLFGADLSEAFLDLAILSGARLTEVDLSEADLSGADLSEAYLGHADLNSTKFNENTTLPDATKWTPDTDLARFTDPNHPDFWRKAAPE